MSLYLQTTASGPHLEPHGSALVLLPVVVEDLERGAPLAQLDAPVLHRGGGHDDEVRPLVAHLLEVGQEGDRLDIERFTM